MWLELLAGLLWFLTLTSEAGITDRLPTIWVFGDLNSGPDTCEASTLTLNLFPQALNNHY